MFDRKMKGKNIILAFKQVKELQDPADRGLLLIGGQNEYKDLPRHIIGDERRFKQVLINLIKNAYKFTDSGGMITVKMSYEERSGFLST